MEFKFPMLLDGATGTRLQEAGMPEGACSETWVLENPDIFLEIQRGYVEAGSMALLTPTFGGNRVKLMQHGVSDVEGYNRRLVELTVEAAQGRALVAGDLAPTGCMIYPYGDSSVEELKKIFMEQATVLNSAGVDIFVIETMMTLPEARAALLAVKEVSDKPVFVTFTADENGRTLSGGTIEAALITMQAMGADAFGLNCSAGPETMLKNIRKLSRLAKVPLIAKPNAGLPKVVNGKTVFDLTPSEFCRNLPELYAAGVRIFGGCCGTDDRHIAAVSRMLPLLQHSEAVGYCGEEYLATEREVVPIDQLGEMIKADCDEELMDTLLDAEGEPVCISIDAEKDLENLSENIHAATGIIGFECEEDELLSKALMLYNGRAFVKGEAEPDSEYGAIKI